MKLASRAAALLAALSLSVMACGSQTANNTTTATDVGVTSTEIDLGSIYPISGSASPYYSVAKGAAAYFAYTNDHGGINGRKIKFTVVDDVYSPANTPAKARELVELDKVFAVYGELGTATNLSVRDYYNQQSVPQMFVFTGSSHWGGDYAQYPWTIGWQPDYVTEAKIYAKDILQSTPNAKIGILYQNDDYGKDYVNGITAGLGSKASSMIVKQVTYNAGDPVDMSSQVNTLKASGADTFFVVGTPTYSANAGVRAIASGWKPKIYMNNVSAATSTWQAVAKQLGAGASALDGMVTTTYLKDPLDTTKYGSDAGVKSFKDIMTKYGAVLGGSPCDATGADSFCVSGMASGFTMVDVLKQAGTNMTRKNVMEIAAKKLNETNNPLLLTGTVVKTTATDHFPIQQEQLQKWQTDHWVPFGSLINARAS
jgi:branched-chain amino acid transport system substrate-binding protein